MGFWELFFDHTSSRLRAFRVLVTLVAMLVLGVCVFARQYLLDRELVRLLRESHDSVETLQRLQSQLVQKEKLASLGQLVAGAAHEINNPLTAILGYSEMLATTSSLTSEQTSMANKISQQARRTRDLVSGLLSFAQQARSEKKLVDISSLIERALQGETKRLEGKGIRVQKQLGKDLPMIWGNANQLFQCCQQIIMNAADALDEVGGGTLSVNTYGDEREVVLEFLDTGPGIREPRRVFDPFYTTKPVGKGTGMGLSATYGVIQDHRAHISCHNREEGGAIFVLRFPTASQIGSLEASAANTSL
jgi:two-component system NtrC family sensor kinase